MAESIYYGQIILCTVLEIDWEDRLRHINMTNSKLFFKCRNQLIDN